MPRTYTMPASQVLAGARALLADSNPDMPSRLSDAELLAYLNDAMGVMVTLVPGLFSVQGVHTCEGGYLQECLATRAALFMDVIGMPEADPATLSQFEPGWNLRAAGAAECYMRVPGDTLRFMLYPPSQAGQQIQIRYAQSPDTIATTSSIVPVPETFAPALEEYVAGRASLADDEHMNSGRAGALMSSFAAAVKALAGGS